MKNAKSSSNSGGGPGLTRPEMARQNSSPTLKVTRLSNCSGLLDTGLGSTALLVVQTVLHINTSADEFPLSLG